MMQTPGTPQTQTNRRGPSGSTFNSWPCWVCHHAFLSCTQRLLIPKKGVPSCSKALRSEINSAEAMLTRRSQDRPPRRASRRARARGAYMRCIEVARRWDAGLADQVSDPPHVFGLKCWKEFVSRLFGPQKPLFFVWHQGGGSSTPWEHPRTSQDMDQVLQEVLQRIEAVRLRERCGGQVGAC